jgi:Family of unknown function (DUF5681)
MTESDSSDRDYKVGPGRPPKHTRFKPGQSGNPKGRPKGRVSMQTAAERELMKLVDVPENGKTRRLTKQAMVVRTLVHQSIKGDHKATDMLIRNFAQTKEGEPTAAADLPIPDDEMLKRIKARLERIFPEE